MSAEENPQGHHSPGAIPIPHMSTTAIIPATCPCCGTRCTSWEQVTDELAVALWTILAEADRDAELNLYRELHASPATFIRASNTAQTGLDIAAARHAPHPPASVRDRPGWPTVRIPGESAEHYRWRRQRAEAAA